jgi:predicted dehydrogenase
MIGRVRRVYAEYHQGWLAKNIEASGQKQAAWRQDPARAGLGGSLGDIGTHAEQLVRFVTGLDVESVCADLTSFVPGRVLDDDAAVLMRLSGGAKGSLTCSQICVGEANGLSLRVYGETGGVVWRQEDPEHLTLTKADGSKLILTRGGEGLSDRATAATRLPSGHPEGFLVAFANIYRGVYELINARRTGAEPGILGRETPGAEDGRLGVRFVEACVESAKNASAWTRV